MNGSSKRRGKVPVRNSRIELSSNSRGPYWLLRAFPLYTSSGRVRLNRLCAKIGYFTQTSGVVKEFHKSVSACLLSFDNQLLVFDRLHSKKYSRETRQCPE